jgi:mannose-6-phosphate isomerase-like protein (cupin superfamily)
MKIRLRDHRSFRADRMARIGLATTERAQLDLYCLEPGQEQRPHAHADQDKIYVVLEGEGAAVLGAEETALEAGDAVVARAGTPHGLRNTGPGRLVALVMVTPPPPHVQ